MKTITITQAMMDSIQSCTVVGGKTIWHDESSNISTIEYSTQAYWFNETELSCDYLAYDARWKGVDDGEASEAVGEWTYNIKVGDVVEYVTRCKHDASLCEE